MQGAQATTVEEVSQDSKEQLSEEAEEVETYVVYCAIVNKQLD